MLTRPDLTLSEFMTKAAARAVREFRNRTARINPHPLIFLGKGKSGTTAIAALFAQATGQSVALDIPALFIDGLRPILTGRSHLRNVIRRERIAFSNDILKQPTLTWLYPQLKERFPGARYAFILRDPRDNIRSLFNRMGIPGNLRDLSEEQRAKIDSGWRWHFEEPHLLGLTGADYIELSAERWNRAADVYLQNSSEMLLIRYEDFLADRIGSIGSLADQLGLAIVKDIRSSLDHEFQPRGRDRGSNPGDFFGEENLAKIVEICGVRMRRLGYDPDHFTMASDR
ncbi:MAG TPA: sulfotransferase [Sphingomicrobium sp.]|nr:sulfotransferase [Sphingomicrobium sp.]